ncbi:MAG: FAD-dependent oxidoreductase [Ruegeria sp.]
MTRPPDPNHDPLRQTDAHAIVIGGGIAGLLSALMLKDRFARVTVLERSDYAELSGDAPKSRPSVPQSHCLHMLMGAGAQAFDGLAPGWRDALLVRGATAYDAGSDVAMRVSTGWLPRVQTGITLYGASRCLIETALLDLIRDTETVRMCTGQRVTGFELTPNGASIRGVCVDTKNGASQRIQRADVVVDASGAASRLPRWFAQHFGEAARITTSEVAPGRQYASCWVQFAPGQTPEWSGLAIAPESRSDGYAGMMIRAENDLWGVVIQSPENADLPTDYDGFLRLTARLPDASLHDALKQASPASPVHIFGRTTNRRRHYEDYPDWPENLYAVGDSVCALDPYAGLGMTAAARGVRLLAECLDECPSGFAGKRFQSLLAQHNEWPWRVATGKWENSMSPGLAERMNSLVRAAPFDTTLTRTLLEIQHMLRDPETLTQEAVA